MSHRGLTAKIGSFFFFLTTASSVLIILLSRPSAGDEMCSQLDPAYANGKIKISKKGLPRLVQSVTNEELPGVAKSLQGLQIGSASFGPDPKKCSTDKVDAMDTGDAWATCYGYPAILRDNGVDLTNILKPAPSDFFLKNMALKDIEFGQLQQIPCTGAQKFTEACFRLPIPKLVISGDISIQEQATKKTLFQVAGWELDLAGVKDSSGNTHVPFVDFKSEVNPDGTLKDLLRIQPDVQTNVPPGAVQFNMDVDSEAYDKFLDDVVVDMYDDLAPRLHLPAKQSKADKLAVMKSVSPQLFKTNLKDYQASYEKAAAKEMVPRFFNSPQTMTYFSMVQGIVNAAPDIMNDKDSRLEGVRAMTSRLMGSISKMLDINVMPTVVTSVNSQMEMLPFLNAYVVKEIPKINIQQDIDKGKLQEATKRKIAFADDYMKNLEQYAKPAKGDDVTKYNKMDFFRFDDFMDAYKGMDGKTTAEQFGALNDELGKLKTTLQKSGKNSSDVDKLDDAQRDLAKAIQEAQAADSNQRDVVAMKAIASRLGTAKETIEMSLRICAPCSGVETAGIPTKSFPPTRSIDNFDIAAQFSLDSLNAYLNVLYKRNAFKICLHDHPVDTCSNSDWLSVNSFAELKAPPKFGTDDKGLYLELPKVDYGASIISLETSGKAYVDLIPCKNGDLCTKIRDIHTADGKLESLISADQLNEMLGGVGVIMPYNIDVKQTEAKNGTITIYGDFQ